MSDHELLQLYLRDHAQTAFATLVERHVDLVYSAARRQVRSPHLAEEVAQSVFVELARCATKIPATQPLAPWLYVVTRRTAIDAVRSEARRLARETAAAELTACGELVESAMKTPPETWSKVEDSLDEAMAALNDTERTAIVLRFFQNLSLREVGESLGISEDTAQKRVSRALERLRQILSKRAVTASAAGLATEISLHAVQLAPAGLAATLSSSIALPGVAAVKAAALHSAKNFGATTAQKIVIATAAAIIVAVGLYQALKIRRQKEEIARLGIISASLEQDIRQVRNQRSTALALAEKNAAVRAAASVSDDPALDERLRALIANVNKLKQRLDRDPKQQIPEFRFLDRMDWFNLVQKHSNLTTDEEYRIALAELRTAAKNQFLSLMETALKEYLKASGGNLPTDPAQLARYFVPPVDAAILQRYEMLATGSMSALSENKIPGAEIKEFNPIIKEKASLTIDADHDKVGSIELMAEEGEFYSHASDSPEGPEQPPEIVALQAAVEHALAAYHAASGKDPEPSEGEKLVPFFQKSEDGAKFLEAYLEAKSRSVPDADALQQALAEAKDAFRATHHGTEPTDALELASYFRNPTDGAKYYLIWKFEQSGSK